MSRKNRAIDEDDLILIECILSSKELFLKVIGILKPKYFESPLDYVIQFVVDYFREYNAIPKPSAIHRETGIEIEHQDVDKADIPYLVDEIERHCRSAAMRGAMSRSIEFMKEGEWSAIEAEMREALLVTVDKNIGLNLYDNPVMRLAKMQEDLDERSIGWHSIDKLINYIRRAELYLFAANSGVGKSIVLQNISKNMVDQGLNGVYVTLELAEDTVTKRMDAIFSGIALSNLFESAEELVDFYNDYQKDHTGTIYVKKLPAGCRSVDLRAFLNEYVLQTGLKPDFIALDYLDLLSPNKTVQGNAFDRDKLLSEEFREILCDYNCYGFSASQMNRSAIDVQDKHQGHIAGGLSKINTSDAAISISRDSEDSNEYIFQLLKLRNGKWSDEKVVLYLDQKTLFLSEEEIKQASIKKESATAKARAQLKETALGMGGKRSRSKS